MKTSSVLNNVDYLKVTDLENIFDVNTDVNYRNMFNLNQTLFLDIDDSQLNDYICDTYMYWPLISYKVYGTTRLAWLLMKINNVKASEMFDCKQPGDIVKIVSTKLMKAIVNTVNDIEN